MEELQSCISEISFNNTIIAKKNTKRLYRLLSQIKLDETSMNNFIETVLPKSFELINSKKIRRDLMYLCLLVNNDRVVIEHFMEYEKSLLQLNLSDSLLLYDYCLLTGRHWLLEIIQNNVCYGRKYSGNITSILSLLKLINATNEDDINIQKICDGISVINPHYDQFVEYYVKELNRTLDVVRLCQEYLPSESKLLTPQLYYYTTKNSLLNTFSQFLDLRSFDLCENVLLKLNEHKAVTETEILTAYIILFNVLYCLQLCKNTTTNNNNFQYKDEITEKIDNVKSKLINIKNLKVQVELLENIFVLVFLQEQHLSSTLDKNSTNFYCTEKEVRLILILLKTVSEEIKSNGLYNKTSEEFRRFAELNKHIADGLWRLELVTHTTDSDSANNKIGNNIVTYLLAPPESLIHISLKQNNFNKARQVIQIFNLQHCDIASEINYNANFVDLKILLRKTFKMQQIKQENPNLHIESQSIKYLLDEFFKTDGNMTETDDADGESVTNSSWQFMADSCPKNFSFMNIVDLIVTLPNNFQECDELFNIGITFTDAELEPICFNFFRKIKEIFTEVNRKYTMSIKTILCAPEFDLDPEQYKSKDSFYIQLSHLCNIVYKQLASANDGKFNEKHAVHKTITKLQQLFTGHLALFEGKEQIRYLQRLINYLKGFSKIFYIEQNNSEVIAQGKNTSYFAILNMGPSEVLRILVSEKGLDISDFEQLFTKLKLDLVYHVSAIFFPYISLSKINDTNFLCERSQAHAPSSHIISHIQKRNWLLAYILKEIYNTDEPKVDVNEVRVKTFINYLKLSRIQQLRILFNNNQVIAALQHQINILHLKSYIDQHTVKVEHEYVNQSSFLLGSQVSTSSLETGEEIFEGGLQITDWKHLLDVMDSIAQKQLCTTQELLDLRDLVLNELVSDCFEPDFFKYSQFIVNHRLRCECIANNFTSWPGEFAIAVMKSELSSFTEIGEEYRNTFITWCERIDLCEKIKSMSSKNTWYEVWFMCKDKPHDILQNLLNTIEVDVLIKFIHIFEINSGMLRIIDENYFLTLFDSAVDYSVIEDLLNKLSAERVTAICHKLLTILKKLEHLSFIVDVISNWNLMENSDTLKNIKISLTMLSCFTPFEQENVWCLISEPSAIIEILIMNTKLEKLGLVLEKIKPYVENCEFDENKLSIEKIDEILRSYAEKSLEFRVVLQPDSKLIKSPESSKLLQSLDSINFVTTTKYFVMPEVVPSKTEWVESYEVTECMCCMQTTFSMFNRRHHCRRCGRVICGACSLKRMQVPTYEDIPVRVCLDCYEQSHQECAGTSSSKSEVSTKALGYDYWLLTNDPAHNEIVREEFSYEYAPSVSLCLAILKHHSVNEEHPKFLLDQCDGMLRLLQPVNSDSMQEIDYLLVIKMLKSLAVAAKMLSAQCMLQWGSSLADRILSQADLLGLLAERDCLHLIPTSSTIQSRYIDANTLRRLRDKLLEREQWNLALEVSTKAGLDNAGVFAAWGKSYLKAGSLQKAREKFQRCFDKTAHYETSTELSGSFSSIQLPHYRSKIPENKPTKNPPLLNEIIQILESNTIVIDPKILKDLKTPTALMSSTCSLNSSTTASLQQDTAICILNKLKNLNNIVAGNYMSHFDCTESISSSNTIKPHLDPLFHEECVYYLTKYGSHISILEFYVKHCDFYECLKYMLDHRLNSDYFIEIYMLCLRDNHVNAVHETMSKIDSTLDIWKDYLKHICRHLEKQSNLNSLYQLQQFMGDFVRAALTCIKFYKDDSTTFSELTSRVDYLHKAQQHLQQELEQEQWVEVASVRKTDMDSQDSFEAKGIANPSLVMKIDSRNVDKHINTIWRQIEVAKFLADCESSATPVVQILPEILPFVNEDSSINDLNRIRIPTLFGSYYERVQLAVLAIVCGNNVEDGFGIAFRIIIDHKLNPVKVYCQAGKQLAKTERYNAIAQLVSCIRSSGVSDSAVTDMCDEMLILAVQTLTKANATGPQLDGLIKLITDRAAKISAYIESKQLKTAYLLAVKHKRMGDIRRILREAEFLNQPNIKALCQKILHSHSHSPSHLKD